MKNLVYLEKKKMNDNNIQKYLLVKKINTDEHILIPVKTLPTPEKNTKLQNNLEEKKNF